MHVEIVEKISTDLIGALIKITSGSIVFTGKQDRGVGKSPAIAQIAKEQGKMILVSSKLAADIHPDKGNLRVVPVEYVLQRGTMDHSDVFREGALVDDVTLLEHKSLVEMFGEKNISGFVRFE